MQENTTYMKENSIHMKKKLCDNELTRIKNILFSVSCISVRVTCYFYTKWTIEFFDILKGIQYIKSMKTYKVKRYKYFCKKQVDFGHSLFLFNPCTHPHTVDLWRQERILRGTRTWRSHQCWHSRPLGKLRAWWCTRWGQCLTRLCRVQRGIVSRTQLDKS